jgi:hypothetical protein
VHRYVHCYLHCYVHCYVHAQGVSLQGLYSYGHGATHGTSGRARCFAAAEHTIRRCAGQVLCRAVVGMALRRAGVASVLCTAYDGVVLSREGAERRLCRVVAQLVLYRATDCQLFHRAIMHRASCRVGLVRGVHNVGGCLSQAWEQVSCCMYSYVQVSCMHVSLEGRKPSLDKMWCTTTPREAGCVVDQAAAAVLRRVVRLLVASCHARADPHLVMGSSSAADGAT